MEVVAVEEPRAEGILEVHAALERAVEAQIARCLVFDDEETVIAGVTRFPDGEPAGDERDLGGVELARRPHVALAVERRPVLRGEPGEAAAARLGCEGPDCEDRRSGADGQHSGRRPEPLDQSHDRGGGKKDDGADGEHLVRAVLRHEPERGRERPGDAAGGRDREQPTRRPAEPVDRPCSEPHGDRRDGREHDAHRAEEGYRGDQRVEPWPGIPRDDLLEHPFVDDGDREHEQGAESDRADQQVRRRPTVGERPAGGVADREPGEDDADQRAPDVERAAEGRREHAARGDLDSEQHGPREEHGGAQREAVDRLAPGLHHAQG